MFARSFVLPRVRRGLARLVAMAALVAEPTACGPGASIDAGRDATVADAATVDAVPDGPSRCNGLEVEPLEPLATRRGNELHYEGDTRSLPETAGRGLSGLRAGCEAELSYERVFSYTMRQRAYLRVSTVAPGTQPDFDTQLVLAASCDRPGEATPQTQRCNDDVDTPQEGAYSLRSEIYTGGPYTQWMFAAGETVLIAVGGRAHAALALVDRGRFELVVTEVPPVGVGAPCDRALRACDEGLDCRGASLDARETSCQPINRALVLPYCMTREQVCPMNTTCVGGVCAQRDAPAGALCDRFHLCGEGLACAYVPRQLQGHCAAPRSFGTECAGPSDCASGLTCEVVLGANLAAGPSARRCVFARASGAPCNAVTDACPAGESCVSDFDACVSRECASARWNGYEGRCAAFGSLHAPCAAGRCTTPDALCMPSRDGLGRCEVPLAIGARCAWGSFCAGGSCVTTWRGDDGVCVADGAPGGACREGVCDGGSTCDRYGQCVDRSIAVAPGGALGGTTAYCTGAATPVYESAAQQDPRGRCVPDGEAGGDCRFDAQRCTDGSTCSSPAGAFGRCQRIVRDACDPTSGAERCAPGLLCLARSPTQGVCVAPTDEREPNDAPEHAQAVALPAVLSGVYTWVNNLYVRDGSGVDCFAFEAPEGASLYAQVKLANGDCPRPRSPWTLRLWRVGTDRAAPVGDSIGGLFLSCPRIDGVRSPPLHPFAARLRAGRYSVCLEALEGGAPSYAREFPYALSLSLSPQVR